MKRNWLAQLSFSSLMVILSLCNWCRADVSVIIDTMEKFREAVPPLQDQGLSNGESRISIIESRQLGEGLGIADLAGNHYSLQRLRKAAKTLTLSSREDRIALLPYTVDADPKIRAIAFEVLHNAKFIDTRTKDFGFIWRALGRPLDANPENGEITRNEAIKRVLESILGDSKDQGP